jgi:BirA family transcriptional regulator, biotin operon repressor / biotin---[acetyl-CoA-carboxylase] ligase
MKILTYENYKMYYIKLNAIDSTNEYLKKLISVSEVESYTIVTAETQTNGKGQMGSKWISESSKNLIVSLLIKESISDISAIFHLNIVVALAIFEGLKFFEIPDLKIKWANDILSGNKKIVGILIENIIKSNGKIDSIIGFGINVNQTDFESLPKASSLKNITGSDFDRDEILEKIIIELKKNIELLNENQIDFLWQQYNNLLFRKGVPTVFENVDETKFMGMIEDVSTDGKLKIRLENDEIQFFEIKEIQMLY